jgi:release factor glutamine methyltransferase
LNPREAVAAVEVELAVAGVPEPRTDAELLVAHVLGVPRSELAVSDTAVDEAALRPLVERRAAREPLQYVLGEWGFRRLTLTVDRRALIPRPETETTVERCLVHLAGLDSPRVLDVGTGAGTIALALADEHPGVHVLGIDSSEEALALARENAERTGLEIELARGDLLEGVTGTFELVVSNPPYVLPGEAAELAPEIFDWEPHQALFGDGLEAEIAEAVRHVLAPGGWLVLETAQERARETAAALETLGYADVTITRDLAGAERVVEGRIGP